MNERAVRYRLRLESKAKIVWAVAAVGVFVVLEGLAISSRVPQSAPITFVVGFAVGMLASRVL